MQPPRRKLCVAAETYSCVAIEALVPGVIASPAGPFDSYLQYNYSVMKCNVELHPALCITFAVSDAAGSRPKGVSSWRFNFHLDVHKHFWHEESPCLLVDSASAGFRGDFLETAFTKPQLEQHRAQGIRGEEFAEQLLATCLVLTEDTQYVLFSSENQIGQSCRMWRASGSPMVDCRERRCAGLQ
eukprot:s6257_g1.t1